MDYYKKYYTQEQKDLVDRYIADMSEIQKKALKIAKEHLQTSFDLLKTSGFRDWIKTQTL